MVERNAAEDASFTEKNSRPSHPRLNRRPDQFQSAARDNGCSEANEYSVGSAVWFRKATPLKAQMAINIYVSTA
jgi:hypothetical protein